jgi:mannose-6-phosphate isomerase-like protein (cupin superfamily)
MSHREVLQKNITRTRTLIATIDKTIEHLKGTNKMNTEEMFEGFSVAAGKGRFDEVVRVGGEPNDCKVSAQDTNGAMCVFEFTGSSCGPRHLHHEQDEWIYIVSGEFVFEVGEKRFRVGAGESVFLPRKVAHGWASVVEKPGTMINVYQPAGKMEPFFRELGRYTTPPIHEVLSFDEFRQFFEVHGMDVVGPPLVGEWTVDEGGRIIQVG